MEGMKSEVENAIVLVLKELEKGEHHEAISHLKKIFRPKPEVLNFEAETMEQQEFEVAVRQSAIFTYKVVDFTDSLAVHQVEEAINNRDWKVLLEYPPGSPSHKPIPILNFELASISVKEDVLRANPSS
jgi:hypothetical protein|tara:strand:- start:8 stop:394 length:387 start_codon:yes stop_codon:yes gene_type:complete